MFLKICGITRAADATIAVASGATALGFVFWPRSPRCVPLDAAAAIISGLPPGVETVGVFVDETPDGIARVVAATGISMVQLHGDEPPSYTTRIGRPIIRSVILADAEAARRAWPADTWFLLDAADPVRRGGTGTLVDWTRAAAFARGGRVVLAGGLRPDNVSEAVRTVRPFGVDVSSGVEIRPGVKDPDKVAHFLARARAAFDADGEPGASAR